MMMSSHTTSDDDSRGFIPSKTVPGRCEVMRNLLVVQSRTPLAMACTCDRQPIDVEVVLAMELWV